MSKIKVTICGGMATITVRLETITELGCIFIRDTCPNLRCLIKKIDVDQYEDKENGKTDATLKKAQRQHQGKCQGKRCEQDCAEEARTKVVSSIWLVLPMLSCFFFGKVGH